MISALETWAHKTNLLTLWASVFFFYSRTFTRDLSAVDDAHMRNILSRAIAMLSDAKGINLVQANLFHSRADDRSFSYDSPCFCDVSENLASSSNSQVRTTEQTLLLKFTSRLFLLN